jgi:hypothetical protein
MIGIIMMISQVIAATPGSLNMSGVDYTSWIGPTIPPTATAPQLDNTGFNMTFNAMFGNANDTANATLDDFDGPGIIGGLTWPYNTAGPIIIIFVGAVIAIVMFVKYDGSIFIPSMVFIATGLMSGASGLAFAVPWEMILFSMFLVTIGTVGLFYKAIVGPQ